MPVSVPTTHFRQAAGVLGEDRGAQIAALLVEALRRFRPAGSAEYRPVAEHLAAAVVGGEVLTARRVRNALVAFLGVEHRAGAVAAYWRELG